MTPAGESAMSEVRDLSAALAEAGDDRLRRAIAVVDAMPQRGVADGLIEPLRPRLARLRPARAVNATRLLFLPLDPVIVAPSQWRLGAVGVPRSALAPLARALREGALREGWAGLDIAEADLDGITTSDTEQVSRVGAPIWRSAVPLLLASAVPAEWQTATGLASEDHAAIVRAVAMVLAQGDAVLRLSPGGPDRPLDDPDASLTEIGRSSLAIHAEFARAGRGERSPDVSPLATMLAVLMLRAPHADRVLSVMERLAGGQKPPLIAAQTALDFVLDGMVRAASEGTLAQASGSIGHAATMLADFDGLMAHRPSPRQRLQEVRAALAAACRTRLESALAEVVGPADLPSPIGLVEREDLARDAVEFTHLAARIGGGADYEKIRHRAVARLTGREPLSTASDERVRLADILRAPQSLDSTP